MFENEPANEESVYENIEKLIVKMQNQEFDLVAVERALLADPEWATKMKNNQLDQVKHFSMDSLKNIILIR